MKKKLFLLALLIIVAFLFFQKKPTKAGLKKVYISKIVDHPALNETVKGIVDSLASEGFVKDQNIEIKIESAQANAALAGQIANKFSNQNPDVVIGVGTVAAQSLAKYAQEGRVKLVFSSITNPVSAGLSLDETTGLKNITGVSNFVELAPQLELFKKLMPNLKKLGFLYNPGELNSASLVKELEEIAPNFNLTIVKQTASNTAAVYQAAVKLASSCDAIFISNDNTALSSLASIVKAANEVNIPVFVSDTDIIVQGALAALGPSQYEIGIQTGKMVAQILNGKAVQEISIEYPKKTQLFLNLDAANLLKINVPQEVALQAFKLIKSE